MALKATIFKAELSIADIDRGYYATHALTVARHPSETDERMMVRLTAFALHANDRLQFGRGIAAEDEADIREDDLTGAIAQWIDVGLPDERKVRRACGRAKTVSVYAYGGRAVDLWWVQNGDSLAGCRNLEVGVLPHAATQALAALADRSMTVQVTRQEDRVWISDGQSTVQFDLAWMKRSGGR